MADYYPLISRAVAGLEKSTGEARRALYERAREALVAKLRSISPALSESDITRERLALEEAIRRVESEAARAGRSAQPNLEAPQRSAPPPLIRRPAAPTSNSPSPGESLDLARLAADLEQKLRRSPPARDIARTLPPAPSAQRERPQRPSASVFLSYSREDSEKVDKIVSDLKSAGHDVWIDRSGIDGGQAWRKEIV